MGIMKWSWLVQFVLIVLVIHAGECDTNGTEPGYSPTSSSSSPGGSSTDDPGKQASNNNSTPVSSNEATASLFSVASSTSGVHYVNETSTATPIQNATVHFKEKEPSLHNGRSVFMPMKPMIKALNSTSGNGTNSSTSRATPSSTEGSAASSLAPLTTLHANEAESTSANGTAGFDQPPKASIAHQPTLERVPRLALGSGEERQNKDDLAAALKRRKRSAAASIMEFTIPESRPVAAAAAAAKKEYKLGQLGKRFLSIRRSARDMNWPLDLKKESHEGADAISGGKPLQVHSEIEGLELNAKTAAGSDMMLLKLARAKRLAEKKTITSKNLQEDMARMKRVVENMAAKAGVAETADGSPQAHHIAQILMGILENSKEEQYLAKHKIIPRKKVQEKDNKKRTAQDETTGSASETGKKVTTIQVSSLGKRMSVIGLHGENKANKGSGQRHEVLSSSEKDELLGSKCTTRLLQLPNPGKFLQVMDVPAIHAKDISLDELHRYLAKKRKEMGLRPVNLASKSSIAELKRKASSGDVSKGDILHHVEARLFRALQMILGENKTNTSSKKKSTDYLQSGTFERRWLPKTKPEIFTLIENITPAGGVSDSETSSSQSHPLTYEVDLQLTSPSASAAGTSSVSSTISDAEWLKDLIMEAAGIIPKYHKRVLTTSTISEVTTAEETQSTTPALERETDFVKTEISTVEKADTTMDKESDGTEMMKRATTSLMGAMINEFENWPFPASTKTAAKQYYGQPATSTDLPRDAETSRSDRLHEHRGHVSTTPLTDRDFSHLEILLHDHTTAGTTSTTENRHSQTTAGVDTEVTTDSPAAVEVPSTTMTTSSPSVQSNGDLEQLTTTFASTTTSMDRVASENAMSSHSASSVPIMRTNALESTLMKPTETSLISNNATMNVPAMNATKDIESAAKRMQKALLNAKRMLARINAQSKEMAKMQVKQMVMLGSTSNNANSKTTELTATSTTEKAETSNKANISTRTTKSGKSRTTESGKSSTTEQRKKAKTKKFKATSTTKYTSSSSSEDVEEADVEYSESRERKRDISASGEYETRTSPSSGHRLGGSMEKWDAMESKEKDGYMAATGLLSSETYVRAIGERRQDFPPFIRKRRGGKQKVAEGEKNNAIASAAVAAEAFEDEGLDITDIDNWGLTL